MVVPAGRIDLNEARALILLYDLAGCQHGIAETGASITDALLVGEAEGGVHARVEHQPPGAMVEAAHAGRLRPEGRVLAAQLAVDLVQQLPAVLEERFASGMAGRGQSARIGVGLERSVLHRKVARA